jgi:hypothetical protein
MNNVYRLFPDSLSTDVVRCTAQLAAHARRGRVKGIAFIAYVDGYGFIANAAGQALEDPTHTRGMLLALDDKLALRVSGQSL